jgi:hypothetical protein
MDGRVAGKKRESTIIQIDSWVQFLSRECPDDPTMLTHTFNHLVSYGKVEFELCGEVAAATVAQNRGTLQFELRTKTLMALRLSVMSFSSGIY